MDNVAIGIVTHNALGALTLSLESHHKYTPKGVKIFIYDNASEIVVKRVLSSFVAQGYLDIDLVFNRDNRGYAAANNQMIEKCIDKYKDIEYLILLNPDILVCEGWIDVLIKQFEEHKKDNIGMLGCKLVLPDGRSCHEGVGFKILCDEPRDVEPIHITGIDSLLNGMDLQVQGVTFACAVLPREVFTKYRLNADTYGLGYYEDADVCMTISEDGYTIWYTPKVTLTHYMGASWQGKNVTKLRELVAHNLAAFNKKWADKVIDTEVWLKEHLPKGE